jgi:hypothetical protein
MSVYVFFIPGRPYNALEAALSGSLHRIGFAFAVAGFFVLITWGQIGEHISSHFTTLRIKSKFTTIGTEEEEEYSQAYSTEYTNVPVATFCTPLEYLFIYYRYKSNVAKLVTLQMPHYGQKLIKCTSYLAQNISYIFQGVSK